jgi:hypothetical protein
VYSFLRSVCYPPIAITNTYLIKPDFTPLYFQFVKNYSALQAGVYLLPFLCFFVVMLVVNGAVMGKTGLYMPWYLVGGACVVLAAGLMHTITIDSNVSLISGYNIILGFGLGCYMQASFAVAQAKAQKAEIPVAVAFITCAQVSSQVLSFAIAYSIFMNTSTNKIAVLLPNNSIGEIQSGIEGFGSPVFMSLPDSIKRQVLEAINSSIQNAWTQILASGALSFVLSLFMKRERARVKK